jgi:hypothetical protein
MLIRLLLALMVVMEVIVFTDKVDYALLRILAPLQLYGRMLSLQLAMVLVVLEMSS